nr:putative integron gene cassette protein [uncultured bacterium]
MNLRNGWNIEFQKNIHMYCHRLITTKGDKHYEVPCEDTPAGFVGIWLYGLELDEMTLSDLQAGLVEWAESSGCTYRIYNTRGVYLTNEPHVQADV